MSVLANASISDPINAVCIAQSADWRQAVLDLLTYWVQQGRCFSSGEVASALRVHRADLRFSVPNLGEHVRDLFYSQQLPTYVENDPNCTLSTVPVSMVPRTTVGLYPDRTPAGIQVFVYGPSASACEAHEFEVFIPNPGNGETMADAPVPATPSLVAPSKPGDVVFIGGAQKPVNDLKGSVAADGRLYIPRAAFEVAVHLGGNPLRGGDPVYVTIKATEATITLEAVPGASAYDLWRDRGKIAFGNPSNPFTPGKSYNLKVEAGKITIAL